MPGNQPKSSHPLLPAVLVMFSTASTQAISAHLGEGSTVDHYFDDLPVVLSATRLAQPMADIPAAVTIIDRQMIRASGAMSVPEILRLVPGMSVGIYSGSRATVSYHGMEDQYARDMQVLVDGRSIYDPGYGGVSWPDMPLEVHEIERIEVIRGPNAAAYGSNSFAGVINIITVHPSDSWGTSVKTVIGEGGKRSIYAGHTSGEGAFAYRLSANYQETAGYASIPDDEATHWLNFRGEYTLDEKNMIQFMSGASQGVYEEEFTEFADKVRELDNRYHYQQLNWTHQYSPHNEIKLGFYHNFFEIEDYIQSPPLSEVIALVTGQDPDLLAQQISAGGFADFDTLLSALNMTDEPLAISILGFKSHRYDLELQQNLAISDSARAVWGMGMRRDSVEGLWTFHQDAPIHRDQMRLFGNLEWHMRPDLVANLGGMIEDFERKDPFFSPRLALNYHLQPNISLRAGFSRAYRMPTLYEDFVNQVIFLGGPLDDFNTWRIATANLEPQRIDSYEVGFLGSFWDSKLSLDLRLFYEKLRNIIDEVRNRDIPDPDRGLTDTALLLLEQIHSLFPDGAFTYTNQAQASIRGFELNLHFTPTPADLLFLGYSYLDAEGVHLSEIENGLESHIENVGVRVPDHTFSILGSHRFNNDITISAAYYFMDDMQWPGEGDSVPSYRRLDLRLAKEFRRPGLDGEIALLAQNLNGENIDFFNNEEVGRVNLVERRLYLQAAANFH